MKAFSNWRPSTTHVKEERERSPGDEIYNMTTIDNNTVLYNGKLLRE